MSADYAAANPHLYQRDVEAVVDAIFGEITAAMANGGPAWQGNPAAPQLGLIW